VLSYYPAGDRVAKDTPQGTDDGVATDDTVTAGPSAGRASQAAGAAEDGCPPFGSKIGRFLVINKLGAGGMGLVLAAQDPLLDRMVAVKLLRPGSFGEDASEKARTRLLREAQAMAKLSHPNVLPVFDAGDLGDEVFIAMELVEGGNLGQWLEEENRSWREVLDKYLAAGRGLAAAHRAGLVHRDFKPANVLVGRRGSVRVADFGLVGTSGVVVSSEGRTDHGKVPLGAESSLDGTLTHTGTLLGTPRYMAPEQHLGEEIDTRADQFSYCVALYEALYGQRPFVGDTYQDLAKSVLEGKLRDPPASSSVPTWVADIVGRGLSRERDDRYPSMNALLADLEHDPGAVRRRRIVAAGLAAVILGLVAALAFALMRSGTEGADPCAEVESELAGIWDNDVKAGVEKTLLASGRPHARESYERVVRLLDTYSAEWSSLRAENCAAARKTGDQTDQLAQLRSVCLAQRRDELAAVTALLIEEPDGQIADKAILIALQLKPLSSCTRENAMPVMVPPPGNPELRARVAELRKDLSRAAALRLAGKYAAGLEIALRARAESGSLDYAPLHAEVLLEAFYLQLGVWDFAGAGASLREAVVAADRGRHDVVAAMARTYLVSWTPDANEVAALRADAEAAIERAGGDERLRAIYLDTIATTLFEQGRYNEAIATVQRALQQFEQAQPPDQYSIAYVLNKLGMWLMSTGRLDEAGPHLERSLATYQESFGAHHPELADTMYSMGWMHLLRGEYGKAQSYFDRALASFKESLGPEHPRLVFVFIALTSMRMREGKPAEVRQVVERWSAYLLKAVGHSALATGTVGWSHLAEGHYEEALAKCSEALAVAEKHKVDAAQRRLILLCLGLAHVELGDPARAIEPLTSALESWKASSAIPLNIRPGLRRTLARALWDSKRDRKRAIELAEQALAEYEDRRAHGYKHMLRELAEVEEWLRARRR